MHAQLPCMPAGLKVRIALQLGRAGAGQHGQRCEPRLRGQCWVVCRVRACHGRSLAQR